MVSLAWPLVFWFASAVYWRFSVLFSFSLWFLFVYPCILLGALLSFAQYIAFIDQKINKNELSDRFIERYHLQKLQFEESW